MNDAGMNSDSGQTKSFIQIDDKVKQAGIKMEGGEDFIKVNFCVSQMNSSQSVQAHVAHNFHQILC